MLLCLIVLHRTGREREREYSKVVRQRQAQPTNKEGSLRQLTDNYLDMQAGAGRQAGRQAG